MNNNIKLKNLIIKAIIIFSIGLFATISSLYFSFSGMKVNDLMNFITILSVIVAIGIAKAFIENKRNMKEYCLKEGLEYKTTKELIKDFPIYTKYK